MKILFLGQCLQYGYDGVDRDATFSSLAASLLRSRFPSVDFQFDSKHLYHPTGLKAILRHRLWLTRPDITVISLPAMFAATSWRVNLVYEIAPEVVDTARSFMRTVDAKLAGDKVGLKADSPIDRMVARRPPINLDDYERFVREAVEHCRNVFPSRFVFVGPGHFNEDTIENYVIHSPRLWSSVNRMVLGLGEQLNVPVVNSQESLAAHGGEVFIRCNHRYSRYGHEIVAREVASVLAGQVAALSAGGAGPSPRSGRSYER